MTAAIALLCSLDNNFVGILNLGDFTFYHANKLNLLDNDRSSKYLLYDLRVGLLVSLSNLLDETPVCSSF